MRKFLLLPLLGAVLLFGGCNLPGENNIVYVDVQKVYSDSKAAQAAEEHMKQVRDALQKGMDYVNTHTPEEIAKVIQPQFSETDLATITAIVTRYYDQKTWKENLIFEENSFLLL